MIENQNSKQYYFEERTEKFAGNFRKFVKKLREKVSNIEDSKQVVRSSGSAGVNDIEANEAFLYLCCEILKDKLCVY